MSVPPFDIAKASRLGNRKMNQDRCSALQSQGHAILVLADGMGGHPQGEKAAQIVIDTCESLFLQARKPIPNPRRFLHDLLVKAHDEITAYGFRQTPAIDPRSTGVVVLVQQDKVQWAHVGDSRFYLFRRGHLHAKTLDHSYVEQLRQGGQLTEEELLKHPQRHYVTRCLGGTFTAPAVSVSDPLPLAEGDLLFLCSDGLWTQIDQEEIGAALESPPPLAETLEGLVREAELAAYPESDNVTAVAMRWHKTERTHHHHGRQGQGQGQPQGQRTRGKPRLSQAIDELHQAIDEFSSKTEKDPQ
jgi:PPM family protein phosphatase